jgi:hypothetical protein
LQKVWEEQLVPETLSALDTIQLDRRARNDRRSKTIPVKVERRKTPRRRQIDPTTCERDYTQDEIDFMRAMDAYKRSSGRMFPTCSEILEVVKSLGYAKLPPAPPALPVPAVDTTSTAPA